MTIESGPPGVNRNYLLTNILEPNGSFLGNYPHGLRMRQIHGLLVQVTELKLRRCLSRKNINYVKSGSIGFKDSWGCFSQKLPFAFGEHDEELTIPLQSGKYWKEVLLEFKFTTAKKLPFEIGSIIVSGSSLP